MKAKQLVDWIEENNAWDHTLIVEGPGRRYLDVSDVWEGEGDGGAVMLTAKEEWTPGEADTEEGAYITDCENPGKNKKDPCDKG